MLNTLAIAIGLTFLNALKPMHIDDTAYYYYAEHATRDPLRLYDFDVLWGQAPVPAMEVLAPPVLPYWWAVAVRLFGENPWAWKLWLFPFCLILTTSLWAIFRRFAAGWEAPLVWMTALSPAILPGINLMLDVPALALNLGSLAMFFRAVDRRSVTLAALAGLVGGLAAQTKYTGLSAPAAMFLYGWLMGRFRLGLLAGSVAALVFGSFEVLIALSEGQSHLLSNIGRQTGYSVSKSVLLLSLPTILGALASPLVILGLLGLRPNRRWLLAVGAMFLAAFCLSVLSHRNSRLFTALQTGFWQAMGAMILGISLAVALRLTRDDPVETTSTEDRSPRERAVMFLVAWVLLEVASYFVLSTFPAARRVMGIIVAMTVLNGSLASRAVRASSRQAVLPWLMSGTVAIGGLYYYVDLCEAKTQKQAVEESAGWLKGREDRATIWYIGHWGFQYYAEQYGFKPIIPDRSELRIGEWLVIPDQNVDRQVFQLDPDQARLVRTFTFRRKIPFRTLPWNYYSGDLPIRVNRDPWMKVNIYQVVRDFIPAKLPMGSSMGTE